MSDFPAAAESTCRQIRRYNCVPMLDLRRRDFIYASAAALAPMLLRGQAAPAMNRKSLVDDLVIANHILAARDIVDGFGHVSTRTGPGADRFLLSRSLAPESVTAADIIEFDLDCNPVVADSRTFYKERFIHSEIYRAWPDVMGVVHFHALSVIPFGITKTPLRPVFHMSAFVGEGVPLFEIRDVRADTDLLISTPELGKALAKTLADKPAALMRGHGAVTVGPSLMEAVSRAIYLDANARAQAQAMALSSDVTYLSPAEVKNRRGTSDTERNWNLWKQQVTQAKK
jgi:HCOMODA/2-hydroxy-3-carboxy-muconic semialdehyde decarboxylase